MSEHSGHFDEEGGAWVGEQVIVVATVFSELVGAAGRRIVETGMDLWETADAGADDLEKLVWPSAEHAEDDELWCPEIINTWDAYVTGAVILFRSVNIPPVKRRCGRRDL